LKASASHIAFFRISALGDIAMCVPCIKAVREKYPEVQISVISIAFAEPLFQEIPNCRFIAFDKKTDGTILGLWQLQKKLRAMGITHFADFHQVFRSKLLRFFLTGSGIQTAAIDKARALKRKLTAGNGRFPIPTVFDRQLEVLQQLNFTIGHADLQPLPKRNIPQEFSSTNRKVGIAPFAQHASKVYDLNLLKIVVREVLAQSNVEIVLFGGKSEMAVLQDIKSESNRIHVAAAALSFRDELALISNLSAMLSMDSANGHLAALYGVPVVTLWGVTHPVAGFKPFLQSDENQLTADLVRFPRIPTSIYGNKFPEDYARAIDSIAPEKVVERLLQLLA
jgi:ADP-heptose:LPS heptosyltransferase